ncbi:hypothetical protein LSM04_001443 [Trypanosoma melophagium]|uniref:uncharacterized protein n=1 Tax=Trypanosoma melophagium TaxID=715481 RepID=UPI00351A82D4|nr:hypothetical protein LSM04_001443 [Trypanosoma melophagium]
MLVLRLVGDEWSWEDRIALAMPPTEGRPPSCCRPTIPLDMATWPQKERIRDGTVLWVRAAPSLVQQERERVFQSSLEEWRKKNGLTGIADDGSDVKRFIAELSSHLNKADTKELSEQEQEARNTIEGEVHRLFAHMIYTQRTTVEMESEEQKYRQSLEEEYATMIKELYQKFLFSLYSGEIKRLEALEQKGRYATDEEYDSTTGLLYARLRENLQVILEKESNMLRDLSLKRKSEEEEDSNGKTPNAEEILLNVRTELQRLLEPVKEMYNAGLEELQKQRDLNNDHAETFLAHFREYIVYALRFIHSEAWKLGELKPLPIISPAVTKIKELNHAMEKQQLLLKELIGEYQNLELYASTDLHEVSVKTTLDALHVTQLNMCRYLETLHQKLSVILASSCEIVDTNDKSDGNLSPIQEKIVRQDESDLKQAKSLTVSISTNKYLQLGEDGVLKSMIHNDTYNIFVFCVTVYVTSKRRISLDSRGCERFPLQINSTVWICARCCR